MTRCEFSGPRALCRTQLAMYTGAADCARRCGQFPCFKCGQPGSFRVAWARKSHNDSRRVSRRDAPSHAARPDVQAGSRRPHPSRGRSNRVTPGGSGRCVPPRRVPPSRRTQHCAAPLAACLPFSPAGRCPRAQPALRSRGPGRAGSARMHRERNLRVPRSLDCRAVA